MAGSSSPLGVNSTSTVLSTSPGDLIAVITHNYNAANISIPPVAFVTTQSVTDNVGDVFTRQVKILGPQALGDFASDVEIWTAFTNASSVTVKVVANVTAFEQQTVDTMASYRNVQQVGAFNGTFTQALPISATNVTISGSSSWIVGGVFNDDNSVCGTVMGHEVQRITVSGTGLNCGDLADTNLSILSTNTRFLFQENVTLRGPNTIIAALELSPAFIDQAQECTITSITTTCKPSDTDTFCPTTGDSCHINFAQVNTFPSGLRNLVQPNIYCTGLTSKALTTTATSDIHIDGAYTTRDANVTNQLIKITVQLSSSAPSTVFGVGACTGSATFTFTIIQFYPFTSQALTTTFSFDVLNQAANTWYSSVSVQPLTTSVQVLQSGTTFSSITEVQLK